MPISDDYVSLEMACAAIKRSEPALLGELTQSLRSVLDPSAQFNPLTVRVLETGTISESVPITYAELASYFQAATGRYVPVLFETATQTVESHRVLVEKDWLRRKLGLIKQKLNQETLLARTSANHGLSVASSVNSSPAALTDQPAPIDKAEYQRLLGWLDHQNDQRRAFESVSRLAIALEHERARAATAELLTSVKAVELENALNENQLLTLELSAKDRTIQSLQIENNKLKEKLALALIPKKTNIDRRNAGIKNAKQAAQKLASEMWITEQCSDYRVGEMAKEVWALLSIGEHAKHMPEHASTVADWLKEAGRPGRPSKKNKSR